MLAELYRPEEAFKVQALNEFVLFGIVALASFSLRRPPRKRRLDDDQHHRPAVVAVCSVLIGWQRLAERRAA